MSVVLAFCHKQVKERLTLTLTDGKDSFESLWWNGDDCSHLDTTTKPRAGKVEREIKVPWFVTFGAMLSTLGPHTNNKTQHVCKSRDKSRNFPHKKACLVLECQSVDKRALLWRTNFATDDSLTHSRTQLTLFFRLLKPLWEKYGTLLGNFS